MENEVIHDHRHSCQEWYALIFLEYKINKEKNQDSTYLNRKQRKKP